VRISAGEKMEKKKWWAMCTELGNYLGMTKDDVSMGIKYRAVDEGLWKAQEVPFSKTGRRMPASTAESDTRQMEFWEGDTSGIPKGWYICDGRELPKSVLSDKDVADLMDKYGGIPDMRPAKVIIYLGGKK
jgi:hypothetical protein